jgi:hypothetical protein
VRNLLVWPKVVSRALRLCCQLIFAVGEDGITETWSSLECGAWTPALCFVNNSLVDVDDFLKSSIKSLTPVAKHKSPHKL